MDNTTFLKRMPPGFYPFWFWNDRLDADEVRWQIRQMAEKGIHGFYIHSRQGLQQPYLSEAFFQMVDAAVEEAQAQGMTAQLYDEYPYPSGVAGGEVVLGSPEYHATELHQRTYDLSGGPLRLELMRGKVLAARAYRLNEGQVDWSQCLDLRDSIGMSLVAASYVETGLTSYNQKRFFSNRPTPVLETTLPEWDWRLFVSIQVEVEQHKYWGAFVDVLNPEAVQVFIQRTHQRYAQRYGDQFGKTILSIYVDETFPGWSARLPAAFQAEYGYDLLAHLEALQDASYPEGKRVTSDMRGLVYRLFVESFDRPISEWCQAHNLAYCGEKPSMRMAQLRYMDLPGCEPGHTKAGAPLDLLQPRLRGNVRATASAAYFYDKPGALDECYHSLGWSGTLQDAKLMADGILLLGIQYLVPHGFFYSTHALRKHDAPPTFFFQTPYWPWFGHLSSHIEQVIHQFEGTHIDAQVLVVDPTYGMPDLEGRKADYRLQQLLMGQHYEFMQVDTDVLQASRVDSGWIYAREVAAGAVIVPPMQIVEAELSEWLESYERQGGLVIRLQPDFEDAQVLRALKGRVQPSLEVHQTESGEAARAMWVVKRVSSEKTVWFLINTGAEPLDLEIACGKALQEVAFEEECSPALTPETSQQGGTTYRRQVAPFESFMLTADEQPVAQPLARVSARLVGPAQVRPLDANLLRMARWQMSLLDAEGLPYETATVSAVPLANQLAEGRLRFAPAFSGGFGIEPRLNMPKLSVHYAYVFENTYSGPVELVMEPDSIVGDWQVWINDQGGLTPANFAPTEAHVRGSLGVDITPYLHAGSNVARVELSTDRLDGGLLNPLYLAGDFGVSLQPLGLVERPSEGGFESYQENGLPFYAGVIEYRLGLEVGDLPDAPRVRLDLDTGQRMDEAMEVSINGASFLPVLWQPRCVELDTAQLNAGHNEAVVRVYTTLIRSFEGQWFDYQAHAYKTVA